MPELEKLSLVAPKLTVIVPHNHPLAVKRGIVMNDLAEHHLVLLQPGTRPEKVSDGNFYPKTLVLNYSAIDNLLRL